MIALNEYGVDMDRVVPGARIRLYGDGHTTMGVVERMDSPRMGVVAVYDPVGATSARRPSFMRAT